MTQRPFSRQQAATRAQQQEEARLKREEERQRRLKELGIKLPGPLKPWDSVDTISKQVIPYFEKGEHPRFVAKKLRLKKSTVRNYWYRWRRRLGI